MRGTRLVLRCFPRADRAFQVEAERLFQEWLAGQEVGAKPDPDGFEARLRTRYPSSFVRARDALASLPMDDTVWYAYRRDEPSSSAAVEAASEAAGDAVAARPDRSTDGPGSAPVYSAARVSAMVGVPVSLLVAWEEQERLVRPARTSGGIALYSRNQVEQILRIKRAFAAGKSVDDVRGLLDAPSGEQGARVSVAGRRLLVLLAERDPYAAEFSEYFLRTEGYDVEVALTALEAESRAAELLPDLAVVELLISGGAGAELCARLKARPDAKVLAISTLAFEDGALRAGADAFLAKPFEPLTFVSTVKDLLGESAMLRDAADAPPQGSSRRRGARQ